MFSRFESKKQSWPNLGGLLIGIPRGVSLKKIQVKGGDEALAQRIESRS